MKPALPMNPASRVFPDWPRPKAEALVQRIKDALNTDEDGDALVEVARNAHRAEIYLARILRDQERNP